MRKFFLLLCFFIRSLMLDAQNIGIGISAPQYKLDVKGSVNIDGDSAYRIKGYRFLWAQSSSLFAGFFAGQNYPATNGGLSNTVIGYFSGYQNTTGANNTFVGANVGVNNLIGNDNSFYGAAAGSQNLNNQNTAMGSGALTSNTTGAGNTVMGFQAHFFGTGGSQNCAFGYQALYRNQSFQNAAFGTSALSNNTTGLANTAFGSFTLGSNGTGNYNTAIGYNAIANATVANANTAVGFSALANNISSNNTAVGYHALSVNSGGDANTALGTLALGSGASGFQNCAFGYQSLYNTNSNYNTAFGTQTLFNNISGIANVAIGGFAGYSRDGLANCTFIGYGADGTINSLANAIAIGYTAIVDASNKVRIGNTSIGSIGGQVGWTTFSDGRFKRNIREDVKGIDFVMQLRPVTYTVDQHALNYKLNIPDSVSKNFDYSNESIRYTGLIAQEVETVARSLGFNFSAVDKPKDPDGLYGIRYAEFVVPLIKAIQEQQQEIELLKKQFMDQQKINEQLMKRLEKLESTPTIKN